ncbi:TRAP transporter small permease subunit [Jannaschia rubra]|uniref:TRAP transporter small permease protein n=1 Tax=Jannaschia rubra TaxID=282197 RepID=A0A0M6XRQ0_9RHOB|nr:TRAP transporter small permease [Jannaschia rubra]CTQ32851.1 TRAP-type C4-dicarboxylate transport system, small permease component [Jannaschia rubra]SFG29334.1 TRAP-type mannitol/chloroaromatic compound transport system, small permease component [Jannaschia rubra]
MSTPSSVLADDSLLSRIDRSVFRFESLLNLLAGCVIFALVCLAVWNVVGRSVFNAPVPGFVDWTEQLMATFAFLGLAYAQREGAHIRMDIVVGRLSGRRLWAAEWLSVLFMLLMATALIYGTWFHFDRSFDVSKPLWSNDSTIDIGLPLWPSKLLIPFALAVLWLRLALQLWAYGRAFLRADPAPVAVPLIEDPAEQANKEAATVAGARVDRNG